jgi:enoyl-CoA hydratase/carnithine racemase
VHQKFDTVIFTVAKQLKPNLRHSTPQYSNLVGTSDRLKPQSQTQRCAVCYMSRDFREGLDAFLNKRQPQWAGE